MEGWIKIDRNILDWEWHDDAYMMSLFIHLLLLASHTDTNWRGVEVKRGQVIITRNKLAAITGLTEKQIRNRLLS